MILNGHKVGNDGYSQGLAYGMMSLFSTLPCAQTLGKIAGVANQLFTGQDFCAPS